MTKRSASLLPLLCSTIVTSSICLASSDEKAAGVTSSVTKAEKSKEKDVCSKENLKINLIIDKATLTCEEHSDTNDGYSHCSSNFHLRISSRCNRIKSMMVICKTNFLHAYKDKTEEFVPDRAREIALLSEMDNKHDEYFKTKKVKVSSSEYFIQNNPVVQVRPTGRICDMEDIKILD